MENQTNIKLYNNLTIDRQENSEVEIKGEIPEEITAKYRGVAIKKISQNIEMPGFRKGHIPEHIIVKKVGEQAILEEVAEIALKNAYPQIVADNNLNVIGRPNVVITKLAPNNPIEFKIQTATMPEIKLADYKTIAKEEMLANKNEKIEITDKEVDDTVNEALKRSASMGAKEDEKEKELPELNDEFVKTLGDFKGVADFKAQIKENIAKEKERRLKEKNRVGMVEKIIEKSEIPLPKIMVESELDKMFAQFKNDIERMKLSFKDYLEKIKKTENALRSEWRIDAEKRAKLQLTLSEISKEEKIKADDKDIEREVNHIMEHHKDANKENVKIYITSVLTNEKVFQFLESQK